MGKAGSQARDEIKKNEPERSQEIFDVIAENPEIEHVPEKMKEPSMEEHGGDQG